MSPLESLSFDDAQILRLESAAITGQTCKLAILEAPAEGEFELERLRAHVASRIDRVPRLRQRVQMVPLRLGPPVWVDDDAFEITEHLVKAAVPGPLHRDELPALVAELMAIRLDHSRPLWRLDVVPLEGGGAALIVRVHHCMADGITAVRMLSDVLWTTEPVPPPGALNAPSPPGAPYAPSRGGAARDGAAEPGADSRLNRHQSQPQLEGEGSPWVFTPAPSPLRLAAAGFGGRLASIGRAAAGAARSVVRPASWKEAGRTIARLPAAARRELRPAAGPSPFDRAVGRRRETAFTSISLLEMKDLGHGVGEHVTVNDVLMATIAGGLREWLSAMGIEPGELRAQIPVSLHHRSESPDELGNHDSFMNVDLPLGERDARERVLAVSAETSERKASGDPDEMYRVFHSLAHVRPLYRAGMRAAGSSREFGLAVSNVPGPPKPVYALDSRVIELYFLAEPAPHHALRVSAISLAGEMHVAFCTDPEAVSNVGELAAAVDRAFGELRASV
ncbi:MAG: DUF1298 domain-containing protein [Solirubrobacterales bacterium]|nr:DUF1298 domain-containing protein [Solirubrobacterales bacterium]